MTLPEVLVWRHLRARPHGLKFRRQHPIGPYVIDFYCDTARLAIELDSEAHNRGTNPDRDERRHRWMANQGIVVVRIAANDVLNDMESVVQLIISSADPLHRAPPGPPPLQGGSM